MVTLVSQNIPTSCPVGHIIIINFKPVSHWNTRVTAQQCCVLMLTARYCGVRVPRPARFPQMEVLLSCWICCTNCCCRRRCSLSLCVSANFTTKGEEQPWSSEPVKDVRLAHKHTEESTSYLPFTLMQEHRARKFSQEGYSLCLKTVIVPVAFILKLTHKGHLPCKAEPGHIPKQRHRTIPQTLNPFSTQSRIKSTDKQITDGDNT